MVVNFSSLPVTAIQNWLQHAVVPRPIGLVSTIDKGGQVNLSPFSFFNVFSSNPPLLIFSPARRGRNNTLKHTLLNVQEVAECVIHLVTYEMVEQMNIASCEYEKGVDEFLKAGFTKIPALNVLPPMIEEATIKMECKVKEIKSLGIEGGAGQLVIAEVICLHVQEEILNGNKTMIDPEKNNLIARLGGDWYTKISKESRFLVNKPNQKLSIGVDALPSAIKNSTVLTGNQLGLLASVEAQPLFDASFYDPNQSKIAHYFATNPEEMEIEIHKYAATLLNEKKIMAAWQVLLSIE